ncbi:MAG: DNA cytosine methyltransferase [Clostridia bacterium]|nr:DNA cytosine methyltransferase [Clostridia bacterium]
MEKTVCELFAGVGGFRIGLEKSDKNWDTVWANQWEPGKKSQHAFDCYVSHFGKNKNYINEDITNIDKKNIPNHNLLVGGFPCQDYSVASTGAKGIEGKKGVLWWQIREILEKKSPKFVLLENVDRLLKSPASQRGRDFGVILACFNDLGYSVEWRVINAAEYGFAQRRRRIFIFACKNKTKYYHKIKNENLENIIHKDGFFVKQFDIDSSTNGETYNFEYDDIFYVSEHFKFNFKNAGIMRKGKIYTEEVIPIQAKPTTLNQIIQKNGVDEKYLLVDNLDKWNVLKGAKDIIRKKGTPHEYHFREGAIAFPDSLDKPARTMLTSEGSINRSTHVIEDPQSKCYRILTPVETERINGFPDNWTETGMPHNFRYFCMGNALVVGLIEKMGITLNEIFEKEGN